MQLNSNLKWLFVEELLWLCTIKCWKAQLYYLTSCKVHSVQSCISNMSKPYWFGYLPFWLALLNTWPSPPDSKDDSLICITIVLSFIVKNHAQYVSVHHTPASHLFVISLSFLAKFRREKSISTHTKVIWNLFN